MLTFMSTGTEQPQWVFAANLAGRAVGEDKVRIYHEIYVPLIPFILRCRMQPLGR